MAKQIFEKVREVFIRMGLVAGTVPAADLHHAENVLDELKAELKKHEVQWTQDDPEIVTKQEYWYREDGEVDPAKFIGNWSTGQWLVYFIGCQEPELWDTLKARGGERSVEPIAKPRGY